MDLPLMLIIAYHIYCFYVKNWYNITKTVSRALADSCLQECLPEFCERPR